MHERILEVAAYLRAPGADPHTAANTLEQIVRQAPRPSELKPLTRKQRRVFDFVRVYIMTQGCPPTLEAICQHFGLTSFSTASEHLDTLQEKGWITREHNKVGTLQITPEAANA
jgi:DNA-binding MarR family transcriptional regulator